MRFVRSPPASPPGVAVMAAKREIGPALKKHMHRAWMFTPGRRHQRRSPAGFPAIDVRAGCCEEADGVRASRRAAAMNGAAIFGGTFDICALLARRTFS